MEFLFVLLQTAGLAQFGVALGAGFSAFAAAIGVGRIGASAMEAIARQPEASSDIRSNMIVSAALVEGVCFFAILICLLALYA